MGRITPPQLSQARASGAFAGVDGVALAGRPAIDLGANEAWGLPGVVAVGAVTTMAPAGNIIYYTPIIVDQPGGITLTHLQAEITVAGAAASTVRVVVAEADTSWRPTALASDLGSKALDATGLVTYTPDLDLPRGRYLLGLWTSAGATFRAWKAHPSDGPWFVPGGLGASPFMLFASRGTSSPQTVPNYNGITTGAASPGMLCPFIAKWVINPLS